MGERLGKAGAGSDLQKDFRQIDTRQQVGHGRTQLQQRAGLVQLVQRPERQLSLALGVLAQLNRGVIGQAGGHRLPSGVQFRAQRVQGGADVDVQAQRRQMIGRAASHSAPSSRPRRGSA
jgi:hypothetical protein